MTTINIRGVDVMFPFSPYECQLAYMNKVIEAIDLKFDAALESPTGTGKTLSLLCSSLGWLQKQKTSFVPTLQDVSRIANGCAHTSSHLPRIYYCSRTHSQLAQVIRELNRTMYKNIRTAVLGSRDQLCIHDSVCKQTDTRIKASVCRSMVSRRTCQYYNKWDRTAIDHLDGMFLENGSIPDIEDMVSIGRKHGVCPFFRCRQMQEAAELILLPYNYIVDPQLRMLYKIDLSGCIIIFDEAHNLESICENVVSVEISSVQIALAIRELKDAIECLQNEIDEIRNELDNSSQAFDIGVVNKESKKVPFQVNDAAALLSVLFDLEVKMGEIYNDEAGRRLENLPGKVFPGDRLPRIFESVGLSLDKAELFCKLLLDIGDYLQQGNDMMATSFERGKHLELLRNFISTVHLSLSKETALTMAKNKIHGKAHLNSEKISADHTQIARHFKLYVLKNEDAEACSSSVLMKFWCFTSSIAMKALKMHGVRTIIVTSGTLSPLTNFMKNIGLDFGSTLENKHVAKNDQVIAAIVSKSPVTECVLNGSFKNRLSTEYAEGIAESIVTLANTVPQGILVFFASYCLMENLISKFKALKSADKNPYLKTYWDQMTEAKVVVVEPKQKAYLARVRSEFAHAVYNGQGAMFFAVCRGKVSEGIDFSDACSRAVLVVGIPYPPLMDARICLKRLYLNDIKAEEKKSQSADEWYVTEGYRAVNQALGRVLRHAKDFGVVALLDERFAKISKEYFPAWIRTSIKVFDKRFELLSSVSKFFDRRKGEIMPLASNGLIAKEREIPDTVKRRLSSTTTNYYEKEFKLLGLQFILTYPMLA